MLRLVPVEDATALARPPGLPAVPPADDRLGAARPLGVAASLALAVSGAVVLARGRRLAAAPRGTR